VARWAQVTPEHFVFDVKLHRLLSRHAAQVDSLPPDLRDDVRTTPRGRVELTPEIEAAVADRMREALVPLEEAGKLGALLLQLSPSFSPRGHELDELAPLLERLSPHAVAIELRHRGWVDEERAEHTLEWMSDHRAAYVCVDAPRGEHLTIMPALDAVTRPDLAYMRLHGRNEQGYLKGQSVAERFGWDYTDNELKEIVQRAQSLAEEAGAVHVMANNNRGGDAPVAARRLKELMGMDAGPPPEGGQLRLA
jgi:uncharacterized protein YecE (DUF72 family)